ncbi:MAG TPA: DUF5683 domain-containing protein [Chitinophagaceae bacterium]|nr:DUF5683 domain-containing protein [Chitinophagaceae bacterium]
MRWCCFIILLFGTAASAYAQDSSKAHFMSVLPDTAKKIGTIKKASPADTTVTAGIDTLAKIKPKHDPHKATLRSLILPGWGQAYNREYWKIPIVYAAIGIPVGTFFYNNTWYKKTRDAYTIVVTNDTADFKKIDPRLFYNGYPLDAASLQKYRNQFRQDRDYSLLVTLLAWGLNVVDATVFGHLKDFDVSDDLSMHVQPSYNPVTSSANIGIVLNFKSHTQKVHTFVP